MAGAMVFVGWLLLRGTRHGAFVVIVVAIAIGVLFLGGERAPCSSGLIALLAVSFHALIVFPSTAANASSVSWTRGATRFGKGYQLSHAPIAFGRGNGSAWVRASVENCSTTCRRRTPTSCWR